MIIWGGLSAGGFLNGGARFNPSQQVWRPLPGAGAPSAREGHSAVWTGARMVVWGGRDGGGLLGDGALYNPSVNQWTALSLSGAPAARANASVVWTGAELLAFGGQENGQPIAALQHLNPQPTWYFYRKP